MGLWSETLTGLRPFQMFTASPSAAGCYYLKLLLQPVLSPPSHIFLFIARTNICATLFYTINLISHLFKNCANQRKCFKIFFFNVVQSWDDYSRACDCRSKKFSEKVVPVVEGVIWGTGWSLSLRSPLIPLQLFLILTRCDEGLTTSCLLNHWLTYCSAL